MRSSGVLLLLLKRHSKDQFEPLLYQSPDWSSSEMVREARRGGGLRDRARPIRGQARETGINRLGW